MFQGFIIKSIGDPGGQLKENCYLQKLGDAYIPFPGKAQCSLCEAFVIFFTSKETQKKSAKRKKTKALIEMNGFLCT